MRDRICEFSRSLSLASMNRMSNLKEGLDAFEKLKVEVEKQQAGFDPFTA